jgi:hypothetical protein
VFRTYIETTETNRTVSKRTESGIFGKIPKYAFYQNLPKHSLSYRVAAIFPEIFPVALKNQLLLIILRITASGLCRSGNKSKQTHAGKDKSDKSTGSYENCHRLQASRHGRTMRKILPSSPAVLITRDHCRPMKTLVQEMYISLTNELRIMESEDLRDKSYFMSRGQSCQWQARGRRTGSKRTFRGDGTRKSGPQLT